MDYNYEDDTKPVEHRFMKRVKDGHITSYSASEYATGQFSMCDAFGRPVATAGTAAASVLTREVVVPVPAPTPDVEPPQQLESDSAPEDWAGMTKPQIIDRALELFGVGLDGSKTKAELIAECRSYEAQ